MVTQRRLLALATLVLGLALVAGGVALLDQPEYTHDVEQVSADAVPAEATPLNVSALSPQGRAIVQDAIRSSQREPSVALDRDGRVPAFASGDGSGETVVRAGGDYVRVVTGGEGVLSALDEIVAWVLLTFGSLAVVAGSLDAIRNRRRRG
jgi:hypothetical protein